MSGIFLGLEIGLRSLRAHQQALNVTAHNIANSSAPGYTRQQALLQATLPETFYGIPGQVGTGVTMYQVERVRDSFLDGQLRNETATNEMYSAMKRGLNEIQTFLNEPSDNGLRTVMTDFWASFSEVANNPETDASRRTAIQAGTALADGFRHIDNQMSALRADITTTISQRVSELNTLTSQISKLNEQIRNVMLIPNEQPNDLKDRRDLLIDSLSGLIGTQVTEDTNNMVTVTISGRTVVSEVSFEAVTYSEDALGPHLMVDGVDAVGPGGAAALGAEIGGSFDLRDRIVTGYQNDLDTLATSIITEVNEVHRSGWGLGDAVHVERDFFTGTGAADMAVSTDISSDPTKLAASSNGLPGDGSNALELFELRRAPTMSAGTVSFDDYFRGIIGELGVEADTVNRFVSNQSLLINEIEGHRQEVQGVSIDEEMTNMVRFQHAYNAAARLITAVDEMLETIVSRMGLTGR